jgi:predicted choloylglycine hydrolase
LELSKDNTYYSTSLREELSLIEIIMQGDPFELGKAHGTSLSREIHQAYAEFCSFPTEFASQVTERTNRYIQRLEKVFPEILQEAEGIAEGSGLKTEQVIQLGLWEEFKNDFQPSASPSACTTIAFAETPDGPIMGKTSDIEDFQRPYYMIQHINPTKGHKLVSIGKVGSSKTEIGMNDKGLVIGTGSAKPLDQMGSNGIERMTLVRLALQYCSDVQETIEFLEGYELVSLGLYFVIMDAKGNARIIEKGRTNQAVRSPDEKGILYATNFYYTVEMAPYMDTSAAYYQNALERFITLGRLCRTHKPELGVSSMTAILKDHSPYGPICAHFPEIGLCSFFGYIVRPRERSFMITKGYPCETEFSKIAFHG